MHEGKIICAQCYNSFSLPKCGIEAKYWLTTKCKGPNLDSSDRPIAIPCERIHMGSTSIHHSHKINTYRGLLYCQVCGSRGPTLKKLALDCQPLGHYGRTNLLNISKGKLPIGLSKWPDQDPFIPKQLDPLSRNEDGEPPSIHYPQISKHDLDPNDRGGPSSTSSMPIDYLPSLHSNVQYNMYQGDPFIDPIDRNSDPNQPKSVPSNAGPSSSPCAAPLSPTSPDESIALVNLEKQILEIAAQQSIDEFVQDDHLCQILNSTFP